MKISIQAPAIARSLLGAASMALLGTGLLFVGVFAWSESDRWIYQRTQEAHLDALPAPEPEDTPVAALPVFARPVLGPLLPVDPLALGKLEIPRLRLSVVVREGIGPTTLRRSAGHVPGTALPGEAGNAVIAGHRDGLFRPLRAVQRGDVIRFRSRNVSATYVVDGLSIVAPDDTTALEPADSARITLITCFPFDYIGAAPRRFVVSGARAD